MNAELEGIECEQAMMHLDVFFDGIGADAHNDEMAGTRAIVQNHPQI